jgi:hypothetical protein
MNTPNELFPLKGRDELTPPQKAGVEECEEIFKLKSPLSQFVTISKERFQQMHEFRTPKDFPLRELDKLKDSIHEARVDAAFEVFRQVANATCHNHPSDFERLAYREKLEDLLKLAEESAPELFKSLKEKSEVLVVAPEREGSILARRMGWLPKDRSLHPQAKRIHPKLEAGQPGEGGGEEASGLIVGLSRVHENAEGDGEDGSGLPRGNFSRAILIDGAIASGGTLVAIMKAVIALRPAIRRFDVVCVHTTPKAMNAIAFFAHRHDLELRVVAGRVSGDLSSQYYAIERDDARPGRNRLIVGDLGDTIWVLEEKER